jgi:hypothetical protein
MPATTRKTFCQRQLPRQRRDRASRGERKQQGFRPVRTVEKIRAGREKKNNRDYQRRSGQRREQPVQRRRFFYTRGGHGPILGRCGRAHEFVKFIG